MLPTQGESLGSRCPYCRDPLFEPPDLVGRSPESNESQCAVHTSSAAAGTCQRCGNYFCPICRTRWHNQNWCIACVERALEAKERTPEEGRAHKRQALLALILGLAAWGVLIVSVVVMAAVVGVAGDQGDPTMALACLVVVLMLAIMFGGLLAVLGIGQAAAAIRTRGNHMILATAGLMLSTLHVGLLLGFFCASFWQK